MLMMDVPRRILDQDEIDGLVREWHYAAGLGERVGPLQHYLGFTDDEMARFEETGSPPY